MGPALRGRFIDFWRRMVYPLIVSKRDFFRNVPAQFGGIPIARQKKKAGRRIWRFWLYPLLILISAMFIYISVMDTVAEAGEPLRLFGVPIVSVEGSALEPALSHGDAVIAQEEPARRIGVQDIVVYRRMEAQPQVGRVASVSTILGVPYYTVSGADGGAEETVPESHIRGIAARYVPLAGYVLDFLSTPAGTVCCIGGPLMLLILLEIFSSIRRAKKGIRAADEAAAQEEEQVQELFGSLPPLGSQSDGPVYHAGSFSPQYAYHPPHPQPEQTVVTPEEKPSGGEVFSSSERQMEARLEQPPVTPEDLGLGAAAPEATPAQEMPAPESPDKKLSLTLSGDESSEFTVNGINIMYEDDTLNLQIDPSGEPMQISVRMRDDEAQLMFKTDEKTTRFAILNREGRPKRISISGSEEK